MESSTACRPEIIFIGEKKDHRTKEGRQDHFSLR
jgi:hypothetical protein